MKYKIYLSPPHLGEHEREYVKKVFDENWIAPAGPAIEAFERAFAARIGIPYAVALSSGTAALHLALRVLGLKPGDEVFCSTLTFSASANPILYESARPVFIDSDPGTWNMDPNLLEQELKRCAKKGKLPRAVITVDLYGQCANFAPIQELCGKYEVPLIEDAAEALGATYQGKSAGTFGWANVFSFNGNKIITTSGGGMLATNDSNLAERARFLSQQARDPAPHYQHSQIGFNYRLSNVLAAIGLGQIEVLDDRVVARRRNFEFYKAAFTEIPGITFMPEASYGHATRWLTCILIDPNLFGATREDVYRYFQSQHIESRPIWKPLHLQPVFSNFRVVRGGVSEEIFNNGLCLPSGSNLSESDLRLIADTLCSVPRQNQVRAIQVQR